MRSFISTIVLGLITFGSVQVHALPQCIENPNSQFKKVYNLFGSAVTGPQKLKAQSTCQSLGIESGKSYHLVARTDQFRIYDSNDFFKPHGLPLIDIAVPSEGDYLTNDTCMDSTIASNEIESADMHIIQDSQSGNILVTTIAESCELKECPKFGACN